MRKLLALLLVFATSAGAAPPPEVPDHAIQIMVGQDGYGSPEQWFINRMKGRMQAPVASFWPNNPERWWGYKNGALVGVPVDSDGYPTSIPPEATVPDPDFITAGGLNFTLEGMLNLPASWKVRWTGAGNAFGPATCGGHSATKFNASPATVDPLVPPTVGCWSVAAFDDFWIGTVNPADPIKNIQIVADTYAAEADIDDPENPAAVIFYPHTIAEYSKYADFADGDRSFCRFGPLGAQKHAAAFALFGFTQLDRYYDDWDHPDRPKKTMVSQTSWREYAPEYQVRFANDTDCKPWFILPMAVSDDYVTEFSNYLLANLEPDNFPVVIEYGNEHWNGGPAFFGFLVYLRWKAKQDALTAWIKTGATDTLVNCDTQYIEYGVPCLNMQYSKRANEIQDIAEAILGDDKVIRTLGTQVGNSGHIDYMLGPTTPGHELPWAPATSCETVAGTWYSSWYPDANYPTTLDDVFTKMYWHFDNVVLGSITNDRNTMIARGAPDCLYITYEGGQSMIWLSQYGAAVKTAMYEAQADPRMAEFYRYAARRLWAHGVRIIAYFSSMSSYGPTSSQFWGLRNREDVTVETMPGKYAGVMSILGSPDTDGDEYPDVLDLCTQVAQTDAQANADYDPGTGSGPDGYGDLCDPDFDNNNIVGGHDFNHLRDCFGLPGTGNCDDADMDNDGTVGASDFSRLRSYFMRQPGPSCCGGMGVGGQIASPQSGDWVYSTATPMSLDNPMELGPGPGTVILP